MPLSKVPLQPSCRLLQVLRGHNKVTLEPSLLQAETTPTLSAFPHSRDVPAHGSLLWPPLDPPQQVDVFPVPFHFV